MHEIIEVLDFYCNNQFGCDLNFVIGKYQLQSFSAKSSEMANATALLRPFFSCKLVLVQEQLSLVPWHEKR